MLARVVCSPANWKFMDAQLKERCKDRIQVHRECPSDPVIHLESWISSVAWKTLWAVGNGEWGVVKSGRGQ